MAAEIAMTCLGQESILPVSPRDQSFHEDVVREGMVSTRAEVGGLTDNSGHSPREGSPQDCSQIPGQLPCELVAVGRKSHDPWSVEQQSDHCKLTVPRGVHPATNNPQTAAQIHSDRTKSEVTSRDTQSITPSSTQQDDIHKTNVGLVDGTSVSNSGDKLDMILSLDKYDQDLTCTVQFEVPLNWQKEVITCEELHDSYAKAESERDKFQAWCSNNVLFDESICNLKVDGIEYFEPLDSSAIQRPMDGPKLRQRPATPVVLKFDEGCSDCLEGGPVEKNTSSLPVNAEHIYMLKVNKPRHLRQDTVGAAANTEKLITGTPASCSSIIRSGNFTSSVNVPVSVLTEEQEARSASVRVPCQRGVHSGDIPVSPTSCVWTSGSSQYMGITHPDSPPICRAASSHRPPRIREVHVNRVSGNAHAIGHHSVADNTALVEGGVPTGLIALDFEAYDDFHNTFNNGPDCRGTAQASHGGMDGTIHPQPDRWPQDTASETKPQGQISLSQEVLHLAQAEMQLAASTAFLQILQKELVPIQNYTQTFLQTILMSLDSKDPDVAKAWLETLLDVIDLLPKDVIKRDVMSNAVSKGQKIGPETVHGRLTSCRILGKIATKFEPFVIKKEILPVVLSLCQDVDYEVRACMCRQLNSVARGLGLESTKSAILTELVELTNDDNESVRLAGIETVVSILSLLDDETRTSTVIPLVCKFYQKALANEDSTLPVVAKQIGKLCHELQVNLTDEQKTWFLDYYKKLCKIGLNGKSKKKEDTPPSSPSTATINPCPVETSQEEEDVDVGKDSNTYSEVGADEKELPMISSLVFEEEDKAVDMVVETRKNAAFNFPAMMLFVGPRHFKSELYHTFSNLCNDPSPDVRKTVASGFHEVAKVLGGNVHILQTELVVLLKDDSIDVLKGVVSGLPETLELLARAGGTTITEAKMNAMSDIIPAIISCEDVVFSSNNWRLQADLMDTLACLPKCFTSDHIFNKFVPLMFRKLHKARAIPVRHASARTLLILLRHIKRVEQRKEMCYRLIQDFCHGRSCYQRILFIDTCKMVMDLFSKAFFKEYFFECLLELSSDPVPNVRLRLCPILPKLKAQVKLPTDRMLLQQLESCVRKLLVNEEDRDVSSAVQIAVEELDRTQVQMESMTKRMFFEDDLADQKKEEEERHLIEQEERECKDEEAKSAKGERRKEGAGRKEAGPSKIPAPKKVSKIPEATRTTNRTGNLQAERRGSLGSIKEIKRTTSTNASSSTSLSKGAGSKGSLPRAGNGRTSSPSNSRRISPGSASSSGSRKGSASSVASSASSSGSRRGSTEVHKNTGTTRRISTGSLGTNGAGSTVRKKSTAK